MAGIGSKRHDFEDVFFRRDDNAFTDVGENSQSSITDVRENPGQVFKLEETVADGSLIRIRCTLSLKKSRKLLARSRSFRCDGNFLSAFRFNIFPMDKNSTRWLSAFLSIKFFQQTTSSKLQISKGQEAHFASRLRAPCHF